MKLPDTSTQTGVYARPEARTTEAPPSLVPALSPLRGDERRTGERTSEEPDRRKARVEAAVAEFYVRARLDQGVVKYRRRRVRR
jgi:hypothetical protein